MKRRKNAAAYPPEPESRFVPYDDWPALVGGTIQMRRHGSVVQTGIVDEVMPDSSALWLRSSGVQARRVFLRADGYQAWISPRDLQPHRNHCSKTAQT